MGNAFTVTRSIDWKKLEAIAGEQEILIGYPEGLIHDGDELNDPVDMADLARTMSNGGVLGSFLYHPTIEKTTKSGKIRRRKSKMVMQGYAHIPARPFIDDGIEAGTEEIDNQIYKYYKDTVESGQAKPSGLHAIAVAAIGAIQKLVRGGYYQSTSPNNWMTILKKGSDKPLIDTGQLINSLTYVIGDTVHKQVKGEDGKKTWTAT